MEETLQDKGKRLQKARDYRIDVDKYILVHVDGRSFSKNIKNKFKKPFDSDFINMMNETAVYLCENVQAAKIAYVQSDEITLLLKKDTPEDDIFFGGRLCKMQSVIASLATAKFNQLMTIYNIKKNANCFLSELEKLRYGVSIYNVEDVVKFVESAPLYQFDCKVWDVDTANDAFAWFLFRNIDCIRNSKQQTAQAWCDHKELLGLQTDEQIALLNEKHGIYWYTFDDREKFGRIVSKDVVKATRVMPDGVEVEYERSVWVPKPGVNLTDPDSRKAFIEKYNFFK